MWLQFIINEWVLRYDMDGKTYDSRSQSRSPTEKTSPTTWPLLPGAETELLSYKENLGLRERFMSSPSTTQQHQAQQHPGPHLSTDRIRTATGQALGGLWLYKTEISNSGESDDSFSHFSWIKFFNPRDRRSCRSAITSPGRTFLLTDRHQQRLVRR